MPYPASAACYAVPNPTYQPAMRLIDSITKASPAVVTTTFAHQYKDGLIVRLDIPPADGMQQANQLTGTITVLSPTTFSIDIDTTFFTTFAIPIAPSANTFVCAMVVPIAERSDLLNSAVVNTLNPFR